MTGRILIFLLATLACVAAGCSDGPSKDGVAERSSSEETIPEAPAQQSRPRVVEALPPGEEAPAGPPETPDIAEPEILPEEEKPASVAATDAELLGELDAFARRAVSSGGQAILESNGTASPPIEAPPAVQDVIAAGNLISSSPYKWGGGHGRWLDSGYDCSGSVSFALFAGGLLEAPMASGGFMNWGKPGPGRWITIYANPGHMYMVVAGLRFDTSGRTSRLGSRWQLAMRSGAGFTARHPTGL